MENEKDKEVIINAQLPANRDIIQSYELTTAKYKFNLYEMRILVLLVAYTQKYLSGEKLRGQIDVFRKVGSKYDEVTMLIKDCFAEEKGNYTLVKNTLKLLSGKTIEFESINEKGEKVWRYFGLVNLPEFNERGTMSFLVPTDLLQAMLDFTKGYRKYDPQIALKLNSVYSVKMYQFISGQEDEKTCTIEQLKKMFGLELTQYPNTADFIKRAITPAQEELTQKADYSFYFKPLKTGRKITRLLIVPFKNTPNRNQENEKNEILHQVSVKAEIPFYIRQYIIEKFDFKSAGFNSNKELFFKLTTKYTEQEIVERLHTLFEDMRRTKKDGTQRNINNKAGYLVSILKQWVEQN